MRNVDSTLHSPRFDYCVFYSTDCSRRLLQQYLPAGDSRTAKKRAAQALHAPIFTATSNSSCKNCMFVERRSHVRTKRRRGVRNDRPRADPSWWHHGGHGGFRRPLLSTSPPRPVVGRGPG